MAEGGGQKIALSLSLQHAPLTSPAIITAAHPRPHTTASFPTNTTTRNRRSHKFKKTRKEGKSEIWVREGGEKEEEEEEQPRLIPCYDPWRREGNFLSARRARGGGEKYGFPHKASLALSLFLFFFVCAKLRGVMRLLYGISPLLSIWENGTNGGGTLFVLSNTNIAGVEQKSAYEI